MDLSRPWAGFQIQVPHNAEALFKMAVDHIVGNGASTLFWKDRWIDGQTIEEVASNLFKAIPKRITRRQTVAQALVNRSWVADIKGALSVFRCYWNIFGFGIMLRELSCSKKFQIK